MGLADELRKELGIENQMEKRKAIFLRKIAEQFREGNEYVHLNCRPNISWGFKGGDILDDENNYDKVGSDYANYVKKWLEEEGFKCEYSTHINAFITVSLV